MMNLTPDTIQIIGATLFGIAILHTFFAKYFERLAHHHPRHSGVLHLLGEVEVVFGFWAMILVIFMLIIQGKTSTLTYLETRNFTEPMFVFAIMVIAGTRPILEVVGQLVQGLSKVMIVPRGVATYFLVLSLVPLLGSFITEPAAMTLAALMLRDLLFSQAVSTRLKYATIGVLFVNISIGGTLTNFAAPPVLMVAGVWQWDTAFMLTHFGWRAGIAVLINAVVCTFIFRREVVHMGQRYHTDATVAKRIPMSVVLVHLAFLILVVLTAHYPVVFMGLLLFFMGFCSAYERHQSPLIIKEALLVAFFLAGLVVLGGVQAWWLDPLLRSMSADSVFFGATALTAFTDNAALTYLGSLVPNLSQEFKIALVAGAVTGGGLTVIANAPNPAGVSILRHQFAHGAIHPLGLLAGAAIPTLVAIVMFRFV